MSDPARDEGPVEGSSAELAGAARTARFERFDRNALAWLAVAPLWTERIAKVVGYPAGEGGLDTFVQIAEQVGVASVERPVRSERAEARRPRLLTVLARTVGGSLVDDALQAVEAIPADSVRARALADLAATVHLQDVKQPLSIAQAINAPGPRALAIAAVAAAAPAGERSVAIGSAIESMQSLPADEQARVMATMTSVSRDPELVPFVKGALEAAALVSDDTERAARLAGLAAPSLPDFASEYLEVARGIADPDARASVLAASADLLPMSQVRELRQAYGETTPGGLDGAIGDIVQSAATLGSDQEAIDTAAAAADRVSDPGARGRVLGSLARQSVDPRPDLAARFSEDAALAFASAGEPGPAIILLSEIAERLETGGRAAQAERLVRAASDLAGELRGSIDAVVPMTRLAHAQRQLGQAAASEASAAQAYGLASQVADGRRRIVLLAPLIPMLANPQRDTALGEARRSLEALSDPVDRAELLAVLAPQLDQAEIKRHAAFALDTTNDRGDETTFCMPEALREDALAYLTTTDPPVDLQLVAREAGTAIANVSGRIAVPPPLVVWAELASALGADGPFQAVQRFTEGVRAALAVNDTTRASTLIAAGTLLSRAVGVQMDSAVRLADRRLTLLFRTANDRRHLQSYLERAEQTEAVTNLLADRAGDQWALHFLGMGGVGKTMLLRQLTTTTAAAAGYATARVDFDYMSPDYPVYRPGQLFLELMGELETFASSSAAIEYVRRVEESIVRLHEVLKGSGRPEAPLAGIERPEFEDVLITFRDFLRQLDRKVLLILDTCEELAKIQSPDATLPSVVATFSILERLVVDAPTLRVVFAGRRLLARSGPGWVAGDAEAGESRALLPDHKSYLRLHEIRGFTADEAHRYLADVKHLTLEPDTTDAILRLSPDTGTTAEISWDPPRPPVGDARFNPFDLSLYAGWAAELDDPSPEQLGSADQTLYVERRIMGRIGSDDVRSLVASAVLLGRFDRAMLRPAFSGSDLAFADAYRELSAQEWIDLQADERQHTTFLQVDLHLYPRLRDYFADRRWAGVLASARRRLAPALRAGVAERSLDELNADYVNAALNLADPADASRMWDAVAMKVVDQGRWDWADQVCSRLLATDAVAEREASSIRASVIALHAAALHHIGSDATVASDWLAVGTAVMYEPDPDIKAWLSLRRAAVLVAMGVAPPSDRVAVLRALRVPWFASADDDPRRQWRATQLLASLYRAGERLVDDQEASGRATTDIDEEVLEAVIAFAGAIDAANGPSDIVALAGVAAVRALALAGRLDEARAAFAALPAVGVEPATQRWLDLVLPARVADGVRLDQVLLAPALGITIAPTVLDAWLDEAAKELASIDAERLASAILATHLGHAPVGAARLDRLQKVDRYVVDRQIRRLAHARVDPLFVTIALGRLALGDADQALDDVRRRSSAAIKAAEGATQHAALAAKARIARRMRLVGAISEDVDLLAKTDDRVDLELALTTLVLTRGWLNPEQEAALATDPRLEWRCYSPLAGDGHRSPRTHSSGPFIRTLPSGPTSTFDDISYLLDLDETNRKADIPPGSAPGLLSGQAADAPFSGLFSPIPWADAHPLALERSARLALRAWALRDPSAPPADARTTPDTDDLARWRAVGDRRLAELALEEGELLAMRLPDDGRRLLSLALAWFMGAGDAVGAFIAATRCAIAEAHATTTGPRPTPQLVPLESAYEQLVVAGTPPELPSWVVLAAAARADDPTVIRPFDSGSWGPWLDRLFVAVAWQHGVTSSVLAASTSGRVPIELRLIGEPSSDGGSEGRSGNRWLAAGRYLLAGAATLFIPLIAVIGILGYFLPATSILERLAIIGIIATLIVAAFVLIGPLRRVLTSLRRLLTATELSQSPIRVSVAVAKPGPAGAHAKTPGDRQVQLIVDHLVVGSDWDTGSPLAILRAYSDITLAAVGLARYQPVRRSGRWTIAGIGTAYRSSIARVPRGVAERLRWTNGRLGKLSAPLAIDVEPAFEEWPWEAILTLVTNRKVASPSDVRLLPYRSRPVAVAWAPRSKGPVRVQVVADRAWSGLVTRAWGPSADVVMSPADGLATAPRADVLHLVGRPIETGSGTVLQVAGRATGGTVSTVEKRVRGMSSVSSEAEDDSSGLLRPEDVDVAGALLIVVQHEPVDLSGRSESDRIQAARLRRFAGTLFRAGAGTVLVLPAMPPPLAEAVIGLVMKGAAPSFRSRWDLRWRRLLLGERGPILVHDLLWSAQSIRDQIASWPRVATAGSQEATPRPGDAVLREFLEVAFDVTVFADAPILRGGGQELWTSRLAGTEAEDDEADPSEDDEGPAPA